jgi:hypothetical protein
MLQELTSTGASMWAVASMLFFIAVYLVVAVRVARTGAGELDARARMALDDTVRGEAPAARDAAAQR